MKKIFIQDWGTYSNETLVCINVSFDEIVKWTIKNKYKVPVLIQEPEETRECIKEAPGFVVIGSDHTSLLWMKEFRDKWEFYETLMHEVHHLVHGIFSHKRMLHEKDANAYQFEYLFREIRRKLKNKNGGLQ